MLTQERVRELFDYREDGELIRRISKASAKVGSVAGYLDKRGYRQTNVDGKCYWNHRLVFLWHHGYTPENEVDHIDRNPSNNRIENLREASHSCNLRNSKVSTINTSGITGVYWCESERKWRSQIKVLGKVTYLGGFQDFTEAVAHRLAAEQCLNWGDCHKSTTTYLYMQKYLEERKQNGTERHHD